MAEREAQRDHLVRPADYSRQSGRPRAVPERLPFAAARRRKEALESRGVAGEYGGRLRGEPRVSRAMAVNMDAITPLDM